MILDDFQGANVTVYMNITGLFINGLKQQVAGRGGGGFGIIVITLHS